MTSRDSLGLKSIRSSLPNGVLLDSFPWCIYARSSNGTLYAIPWDSHWRVNGKGDLVLDVRRDRRVGQRRIVSKGSLFRGVREERIIRKLRRDPSHSLEARQTFPCEVCGKIFENLVSLVAHSPCRANQTRVNLGFVDTLSGMRGRFKASSKFRDSDVDDLRKIMLASLSSKAYEEACKGCCFSPDSRLSDAWNLRRFRAEWFAALLSQIRLGLFDPRFLSMDDWESVSSIADCFLSVRREDSERDIVRRLFDLNILWHDIAGRGNAPADFQDDTARAVRSTPHLHGYELACEWDRRGVPIERPWKNWEDFCDRNRPAFDNRVSRLRAKYDIRPTFPPASSH